VIDIDATNGTPPDATQSFTLTVEAAGFHITTTSLPDAMVGTPYSQQLTTSGGGSTIVWKKVSLPKGFYLSSSGLLTGTPSSKAIGPANVDVSASSDGGTPVTASIPLTINEAPVFSSKAPKVAIFYVGEAGSTTVTASGYPAPTLSETGTLPSGVTFDPATGDISGTPPVSVNSSKYDITINASNGLSPNASRAIVVTVYAPLAIATSALPDAVRGTAYDGTGLHLQATGAFAPYHWTVIGTLPEGLVLSSGGVLHGTPSTTLSAGSYSIDIQVTAKEGKTVLTVTKTFTMQIS
jgi:hypothetical protein